MKDIKFRVWDFEINRMLRDYFFIRDGKPLWHKGYGEYDEINGELMQFTGVYDRNQRPIFEEDIVSFGDMKVGIVKFGLYKGQETHYGYYASRKKISLFINPLSGCGLEILGNRFENPELIGTRG